MLFREAYEHRDITSVVLISGSVNPADDVAKQAKRCSALAQVNN